MKIRLVIVFTILLLTSISFAQKVNEKKKKEILQRGFKLYYLEMASWISTDLILEEKKIIENIGGYLSYFEHVYKTIFWDKENPEKIIATVYYKEDISTTDANINIKERAASPKELELIEVREAAMKYVNTDTTGFFEYYENTSFNPIPLVIGNRKYVYLLTGPKVAGVVVFGNDYLFTYNSQNKLLSRDKLHNNIMVLEYDTENMDNEETLSSMHTHGDNTSEYITETDICTLLLYGDFTNWEKHYVISDKFVSMWDIKSSNLFVLTKEAWERISNTK